MVRWLHTRSISETAFPFTSIFRKHSLSPRETNSPSTDPCPVAHLSFISQLVRLWSPPGRFGMRSLPHGSIPLSSGKQLPYASIAARAPPERAPPAAGVRAISDSSSLLHEPRPAHSLTLSRSPARRQPDLRLPPVPRCQPRYSSRLHLRTQRLAAPNPHAPAALKPEFSTARARDCRPQCPAGLARRLAAPRPCKPPFGRPDAPEVSSHTDLRFTSESFALTSATCVSAMKRAGSWTGSCSGGCDDDLSTQQTTNWECSCMNNGIAD
ncbi:hypothetical protein AcV5_006856 [Taiwanofungus camphoratus]|nr:hypothetical protein AcV5_006856 [Antrodia cinnamomea]